MSLSRRRLLPLPLLLAIPGALTGCKSAGIRKAFTSRDSAGRLKTSVFKDQDTEIHLIVEFVSGREDAVLLVELFVPHGSRAKFEQVEIAPGKGEHRLDIKLLTEDEEERLSNKGPWQVGLYEVDLLIDDDYDRTVKFQVIGL